MNVNRSESKFSWKLSLHFFNCAIITVVVVAAINWHYASSKVPD